MNKLLQETDESLKKKMNAVLLNLDLIVVSKTDLIQRFDLKIVLIKDIELSRKKLFQQSTEK